VRRACLCLQERGKLRDQPRRRRADFDHMLRLSWVKPAEWREVRFGTSRASAVDVPMFRTADINALPAAHPDIDWEQLRTVGKGQRSPLAALP
jgi:hypothetical protein